MIKKIINKLKQHSEAWYRKKYYDIAKTLFYKGTEPDYNKLSDTDIKRLIMYLTPNHGGKMLDMFSISTSCHDNKTCQARHATPGTPCYHCYAWEQLENYLSQRIKLHLATHFYTTHRIKASQVPRLNIQIARYESFGEINNTLQLENYATIAEKNPVVIFTLWSKNLAMIDRFIAKHGKPTNWICVQSNEKVDHFEPAKYWWIDKTFTVVTEENARENNLNVNCAASACNECRICYTKTADVVNVFELLR